MFRNIVHVVVFILLTGNVFADEWYRIKNPHSLVADHYVLLVIRFLKQRGETAELKELYHDLSLLDESELGPSDCVIVDHKYDDGIVWIRYLHSSLSVGKYGFIERKELGKKLPGQPASEQANRLVNTTPPATAPPPRPPIYSLTIVRRPVPASEPNVRASAKYRVEGNHYIYEIERRRGL